MKLYEKIVYRLSLVLAGMQVAVILLSWLITAALPDLSKRSLLSSSGIRWFFGNFVSDLAQPVLVWMVLLTLAVSGIAKSGLWNALSRVAHRQPITTQLRFSLSVTVLVALLEVVAVSLLIFLPHAILLSVTGKLFPSSFSSSFIPIIAFILVTSSLVFGMLSGRIRNVVDLGRCLCSGGQYLMPLLLLYVLAAQLVASIVYVFAVP